MARTLPLVTAGYVGSLTNRTLSLAIPGKAVWSEEQALPFTTTGIAPPALDGAGDPTFAVYFPVDTVISIGPGTPNASTSARYFVLRRLSAAITLSRATSSPLWLPPNAAATETIQCLGSA